MIICEGYFDVIMLHKAGFKRAVATLGTALTKEHLPLLKKTQAKVILAYDGDRAGVNAAIKASKLLAKDGFEGGVVLFPAGLDPADMVKSRKTKELDSLFREPKDFITFVLEQIAKSFDLSVASQKELAFKEAKAFLNTLSPIIKEASIPKASLILDIPVGYFKTREMRVEPIESQKKDVALEAIIKTVLQDDRLIDEFLDIFSPQMMRDYSDVIEALSRRDFDHPKLISISIDDTIKPLNQDSFKRATLSILERFYRAKLEKITKSKEIPYSHKSYWIRKIKTDILPRIKRGEIVVYESDFPI
jgi:DNA primase